MASPLIIAVINRASALSLDLAAAVGCGSLVPVQRRPAAVALSLSPLSSARSKTISPCLRSPAQGARQAASKTVAEGAVRRAGAGDGDSGSPIVVTDARQEVTVSQFVAQLDEAARRRLNSMHQATTEQPDLNKPKL
ncbi:uncharacterized protein [Zea mays]|uniref:uncharacterized protein n=1 Tax=Zea mays TaxID=4577 RepID=UPI0009AA9BA7|nr:uncharacterized protein LOC103644382 [Zea mays]|eukprot:XP_020402667.1 uncharacterized protein LOC103644382 [Zea mays]